MKRGLLIIALALIAGLAAFCAMRWHKSSGHHAGILLDSMPELAWLRSELKLTDEQFVKVRDLHVAYRPKCADMCRRIAEAHEKIGTLASANSTITPDYRAALKEHADIHLECQETMLKHLYETAAVLNKEQSQQYLKTMLPFALDFTHSESGTLHVR